MPKKIIVNKFGGGILKKELIPIIVKRLKEQIKGGYHPVVVVSAFPSVTDKLVSQQYNYIKELRDLHKKIMLDMGLDTGTISNTEKEIEEIFYKIENRKGKINSGLDLLINEDTIVSQGEKLSATILTAYLNSSGLKAERFLAEEIPIVTDDNFKNANIKYDISVKNVKNKILNTSYIPIIAGFTGVTKDKYTTTLGRGGTDTTACFVGSALEAEKVILWKDVGGVLSADPKIISKAKTIPFINYFEAEEAGKVIHDKAIQYIKIHKTPIEITSLVNPKLKTIIGDTKKIQKGAKLVSIKNDLNFILVTDENIPTNELILLTCEIFKKYKIDITLISNTRYSLQIVTDNKNAQLDKAYKELEIRVNKISLTKASMIFLIGWFDAKDVSNFNDLLVKQKTELLISAFYYEDCYRMEAVIQTENINNIMKAVYNKFIR